MINHNEATQENQANPANQANDIPVIKTIFTNSDIKKQLAERGLHGLEFDHSSFPTICLRSTFEMSDDPTFNLSCFDVSIMQSLEKHILTDIAEESKRVMTEVKYSRDGVTTADGERIADYMKYISDKGGRPVLKKYLDLLVQLHTNDHHNQKLAVLSISPTSVSRVSVSDTSEVVVFYLHDFCFKTELLTYNIIYTLGKDECYLTSIIK